ncbi:pantoate--beta-alanine ligase [Bacillus infantis]|uniref:pantoate--beta-alanine ligase n=1 Tax=Bacillus infantis TaxID=324767 RepID=UPI000B9A62A5|nr:pantoate--beta-alanine ligase [Bacillus infantis]MCK6204661.1 pantoate--beta-alanine ligase [Bacillus infantis]OXT19340.1 pantoate--beta-alanine ligase [Bacillus sp. OG2]
MKIITSPGEMQQLMLDEKKAGRTIGFVPTMGYLHEGHLSLLKRAGEENDVMVLSIFVNPLQFGPAEDLDSYPRDFERDSRLAEAEGADYLFSPAPEDMYPGGVPSVSVIVNRKTDVLCGKSRPGHFDGVATVVSKLFHIVSPDKAYFGKKDAQQLAVIESLAHDLNFPVKIIGGETVREPDGLAKSSRNVRLLPEERKEAPVLYESLSEAARLIAEGTKDTEQLKALIRSRIKAESSGSIDYAEILSWPELKETDRAEGTIIIALAVKFKHARLIDNIIIAV